MYAISIIFISTTKIPITFKRKTIGIKMHDNSISICIYLPAPNMKNTSKVTDFIFDLSTLEVSYHWLKCFY